MFFYLSVFFFLFLLTFLKNRDSIYWGSVILLLLIAGLRSSGIGIDTSGGYYTNYLYIEQGINTSWLEYGWVLLNKACILLNLKYQGVIAFSALLSILPVAIGINKTAINRQLSIAIYYGMYMVLYSFNLMRQSIAIAFCFLAVCFFSKKEYKKMLVCFLVAILFHKTSIIVWIIVLISRFRLSFKEVLFINVVSILLGSINLTTFLQLFMGKYAFYLQNTDGYAGYREDILLPFILTFCVTIFFMFIMAIKYEDLNVQDSLWYKLTVLGIIVMNLTYRLGQGTRIVLYFSVFQCIFMPELLEKYYTKEINKRLVGVIYVFFLLINFMRILYVQLESMVPYRVFYM